MQTTGIFKCHQYKISLKSLNDKITIIPFGDVHRFAPLCNVEKWHESLARMKSLDKANTCRSRRAAPRSARGGRSSRRRARSEGWCKCAWRHPRLDFSKRLVHRRQGSRNGRKNPLTTSHQSCNGVVYTKRNPRQAHHILYENPPKQDDGQFQGTAGLCRC